LSVRRAAEKSVSTVFADTFYWIALTTPLDAAHERAKKFTDDIVTTQEVLTEYLNFFSSGPEHLCFQSLRCLLVKARIGRWISKFRDCH